MTAIYDFLSNPRPRRGGDQVAAAGGHAAAGDTDVDLYGYDARSLPASAPVSQPPALSQSPAPPAQAPPSVLPQQSLLAQPSILAQPYSWQTQTQPQPSIQPMIQPPAVQPPPTAAPAPNGLASYRMTSTDTAGTGDALTARAGERHHSTSPRRSPRVALVVDSLSSYQSRLIDGLQSGLRRHGIDLLVLLGSGDQSNGGVAGILDGAGVRGIVATHYPVMGGPVGLNPAQAAAGRLGDLPTVVIGERLTHLSTVTCDNTAAMAVLLTHLMDEGGVRAPAFIRGTGHAHSLEREQAFRAGAHARGIAVPESRILEGRFDRYVAYTATKALLASDTGVDAIVAANDAMAEGALDALAELGRDVPQQVKVSGFDGDARSARTGPPLTTIDQRLHEQGEAAADLMAAQLGGDHQARAVRLEGRLIVRRSTRGHRPPSVRRVLDTGIGGRDALLDVVTSEIGPCPPVVDAAWARRWLERLRDQLEDGVLDETWIRSWGRPTGTVDDLERATAWLTAAARVVLDVIWRQLRTPDAWFGAADVHASVVVRLAAVRADGTRTNDRTELVGLRHTDVISHALDAAATVPALLALVAHALPSLAVTHCFVVLYDDDAPSPRTGSARLALAYVDQQTRLPEGTAGFDLNALLSGTVDDGAALVVQPLTDAGRQFGLLLHRRDAGRPDAPELSALGLPGRIVSLVDRERDSERAQRAEQLLAVKSAQLDDEIDSRLKAEDELRRANRELTRSLLIDSLTGIHNRASLDEVLDREFDAHAHSRRPLAALMIDVDHFKSYNDRYGHLQGDATLRQVAELLRSVARRGGDVAARYGGEEFALVLPDTDGRGAERVARGFLDLVRDAGIEHSGAPSGRITVSIGAAAVMPSAQWQASDLLQAADTALYQAKAAGRDRMVAAEPRPQHETGSHAAVTAQPSDSPA